jgi:hypothetical protein
MHMEAKARGRQVSKISQKDTTAPSKKGTIKAEKGAVDLSGKPPIDVSDLMIDAMARHPKIKSLHRKLEYFIFFRKVCISFESCHYYLRVKCCLQLCSTLIRLANPSSALEHLTKRLALDASANPAAFTYWSWLCFYHLRKDFKDGLEGLKLGFVPLDGNGFAINSMVNVRGNGPLLQEPGGFRLVRFIDYVNMFIADEEDHFSVEKLEAMHAEWDSITSNTMKAKTTVTGTAKYVRDMFVWALERRRGAAHPKSNGTLHTAYSVALMSDVIRREQLRVPESDSETNPHLSAALVAVRRAIHPVFVDSLAKVQVSDFAFSDNIPLPTKDVPFENEMEDDTKYALYRER